MKRRRFIRLAATGIAGLALPSVAGGALPRKVKPYSWNGFLLGAHGQFRLYSDDEVKAKRVIEHCFEEIRRLERIFSLYDSSSSICTLNRVGVLESPPPELVAVLAESVKAQAATGGGFDPTIQPLWSLYAEHFRKNPDCDHGPSEAAIAAVMPRVGIVNVEFDDALIRFQRPGMALTLNGVAQGYITDCVADTLRSEGFGNVLVELGETRALGSKPGGASWRMGVLDARTQDALYGKVELCDQALASSGGYGSPFDTAGKFHHLLDPRTGRPASHVAGVSVVADRAVEADALSTGLCIAKPVVIERLIAKRPDLRVLVQA